MNVFDTARVRARFVVLGQLEEPDTIVMRVTPPDGSGAEPYEVGPGPFLVRQSAGYYHGFVPINGAAGRWRAEVIGTGSAAGSSFITWYALD